MNPPGQQPAGTKPRVGARLPIPEPAPRQSLRAWLALLARGMAMGVAELIPGVSGGTIAFVTGIYDELVRSLARFGPESVTLLLRRGPVAFWRSHNLGFLAVLALGMLSSVLLLARLFQYLLETFPAPVWAFFFGLIVAAVVHVGRGRPVRALAGFGVAGLGVGLSLLLLEPVDSGGSLWLFFGGGVVAVCAWLLPAVSGSFFLLVLGLYEPVLRAINEGDIAVLAALGAGCVAGILTFARLLSWLMWRVREPLLAFLTGLLLGSLAKLWPWHVDGTPLLPGAYALATGLPPMVLPALGTALLGTLTLWLLTRFE